ncbi:MAG: hypothetical protein OQK82_07665 [Candidatus Pacearchaeota archaeon]|nr:hypothetical protein [Candidatus Pacearchaeota archaeon]
MSELRLLIIEDDDDQQTLYKDAIENDLGDTDVSIVVDFEKKSAAAIEALKSTDYDAVIIDLLLEGDSSQDGVASGNDVLKHIFDDNGPRLLVYVVSGTLHSLDAEHNEKLDNALLNKFDRAEPAKDVLEKIIAAYETGVTKLLGNKGQLEKRINDIFFSHLAEGFDTWINVPGDSEKELLRYTLLHLIEYLDLPESGQDSSHKYQPAEFYIVPPIKRHISSCDIVEHEGKRYLLMSPACDVEPRGGVYNVDRVTLVTIHPLAKEYFESKNIEYSSDGVRNSGKWRSFRDKHRGTSPKNRYHYMPEYGAFAESLIDFTCILSINIDDYLDEDKTKRLATVSSPFRRDIQARFSAYYGRQGQPEGAWS